MGGQVTTSPTCDGLAVSPRESIYSIIILISVSRLPGLGCKSAVLICPHSHLQWTSCYGSVIAITYHNSELLNFCVSKLVDLLPNWFYSVSCMTYTPIQILNSQVSVIIGANQIT